MNYSAKAPALMNDSGPRHKLLQCDNCKSTSGAVGAGPKSESETNPVHWTSEECRIASLGMTRPSLKKGGKKNHPSSTCVEHRRTTSIDGVRAHFVSDPNELTWGKTSSPRMKVLY